MNNDTGSTKHESSILRIPVDYLVALAGVWFARGDSTVGLFVCWYRSLPVPFVLLLCYDFVRLSHNEPWGPWELIGWNRCIRDTLLENDSFGPNLQILQQYPRDIELVTIIHRAIELRDQVNHARQNLTAAQQQTVVAEPEPEAPVGIRGAVMRFFSSSS